jgi:hypothetical protein
MADQAVPDFTKPRPTALLRFKIDDDYFEAVPEIGPGVILDVTAPDDNVARLAGLDPTEASPEDVMKLTQGVRDLQARLMNFLDSVLIPESAQLFAARLRAQANPITLEQCREVVAWLIGQYSNRPTEPPKPSSSGRGGRGRSSTVTASPKG